MDLFHGFHDYEVGDSIKNAEILSNVLESLSVVDDSDKEKVNEISLKEDSDIKIGDSDILEGVGGSELYLVSIDNNNLDVKDVRKTVSSSNIPDKLAAPIEEELKQHQHLKLSKSKQEITTWVLFPK